MIGAWSSDPDGDVRAPGAAAGARGPEHRVAALTLAALLVVGGLMGTLNLFVDGVLARRAPRWVYGATMALCMAAAVPLVVRKRAGRWHTFGLVLLGDLIYLVVVLCIEDPVRYATPLMLLFPSFVAAWFLGPWELATNMVVTTRRLPGRAVAQLRQRGRPRRPGGRQRRARSTRARWASSCSAGGCSGCWSPPRRCPTSTR